MKKEVLVFILFITVLFVLGAGCEKQEEDIDFSEAQALIEWSESIPSYYYSSQVSPELQAQLDSALEKNSVEECEKLVVSTEEETGEEFQKKVDALHKCVILLTKQKAFIQKNQQDCDEFYTGSGDDIDYEECIAPIAAFRAIVNNDKDLCKININNEELLELCEKDYERFN